MGRLVQPTIYRSAPRGDGQFESLGGSNGGQLHLEAAPRDAAKAGYAVDKAGDDYIDRVAKYIPGEVLAAYMVLDSASQLEVKGGAGNAFLQGFTHHLPLLAFLIGAAFTPLYIYAAGRAQKAPWGIHAVVSFVAFLVWAYATKGNLFHGVPDDAYQFVTGSKPLYNPQFAMYALVVFTLLSGFAIPQALVLTAGPARRQPEPGPGPGSGPAVSAGPETLRHESLGGDLETAHVVHAHHEPDTEPDLPYVLDQRDPSPEFESTDPSKVQLWIPKVDKRFKMRVKGTYPQGYPIGAVIHSTEGRSLRGDANAEDTINEGVGENYCYICISSTGKIYQSAPLDKFGSHAGESYYPGLGFRLNNKLIGIEVCCAGIVQKDGDGFKPAGWNERFRPDEVRYSDKIANVTQAGFYHRFNAAQEESLIELLLWLKHNNPDVFRFDYVLGHDEVATIGKPGTREEKTLGRKQDPGASLSLTMPDFREKLFSLYAAEVAAAPSGGLESTGPASRPFQLPEYAQAVLGRSAGVPWDSAEVRREFNFYSGLVTNSVHVFGSSAVFYASKLDIDNDGSAGNAAGDPNHQSGTSLHDIAGRPLNADQVPFIVLPKRGRQPYLWSGVGVGVGDLAMCFYKNGASCAAIVGDVGPSTKIGEGSTLVARHLGIDPDPNRGGLQEIPPGVMHVIFPGSRRLLAPLRPGGQPRTEDVPATIAARAAELFARFKGGNGGGGGGAVMTS